MEEQTQGCEESIPPREEEATPKAPAHPGEGLLLRLIQAANSGPRGEAEVAFLLGEIYAHGLPKDEAKAAAHYADAMTKKHVEAHYKLGLLYDSGCGVAQNVDLALRRFKKAAELGHAGAQFLLGKLYVEGRLVGTNKPRGCDLLHKAAGQGHAEAARLYAQVSGEILRKHLKAATPDNEKLWAATRELARKTRAETQEAWYAQWGWHPPKDEKKQKKWYAKALQNLTQKAEAGNVEAQWQLAEIYWEGLGVGRNHATAHMWYKTTADSYLQSEQPKEAEANYRLGEMFLKGRGVGANRTKAMEWFQQAAEQGHAHAQYQVGKMYAGGECGSGKMAQAINWLQKAAHQGHAMAQFHLKKLSLTGQGASRLAKAALAEVVRARAEAALAEMVRAEEEGVVSPPAG